MPSPKPAALALPTRQPPDARLAAWTQLRDELVTLNAKLEYLRLMIRLDQRQP